MKIIVIIIILYSQSLAFARGQTKGDLPSKADVQNQLDTLNNQKDHSAQDKLVQQDLIDTLATLDKIERMKEETVQLRQKVAQAPEKMRQATAALNALSDVDNDDEMRKTLSALSLRQLELRVAQ
ncbi:mechanosensitive channel MscK, partial [Salmonella enterica subsp. enterica serovar Kentucky]